MERDQIKDKLGRVSTLELEEMSSDQKKTGVKIEKEMEYCPTAEAVHEVIEK